VCCGIGHGLQFPGFRPQATAVEFFTADFLLTTQANASFSDPNNPNYYPEPFLISPTLSPLQGKIWFNYELAEMRIEFFNGPQSPWKLATTMVAYSYNYSYGEYSFNCTTDIYWTAGMNRCWYGNIHQVDIPNEMGGEMNLTYNGTKIVDGYDCMIFVGSDGTTFAVRLLDLAIVEIDLPYFLGQVVPYFNFFGNGAALTQLYLSNIVVGPPSQSNFNPPGGTCIQIYNDSVTIDYKKDDFSIANFIPKPIKDLFTGKAKKEVPVPVKYNPMKRDSLQQKPPYLNQTFSADWIWNVNNPYPPYTPVMFAGTLGFDFTQSGFVWTLDSTKGNFPVDLQISFRLYPNRDGVEWLQVGLDGSCWSIVFLQWIITLLFPVFEVPPSYQFNTTATVNGDVCSLWNDPNYPEWNQIWIRNSDNVLVQSVQGDPITGSPSFLTFSNIKGTVPPSSYARPATCPMILNWSHAFDAHLPWGWCNPFC
jgi:hypothetical protein